MGLKLTLPKTANSIGADFVDAYWVIQDMRYEMQGSTLLVVFWLNCYATREASKLTGQPVQGLPIGRPILAVYDGKLYEFTGVYNAADLFPSGIPVSFDEQKTVIYNWIKAHTDLPFEDVLEEEGTDEEGEEEA